MTSQTNQTMKQWMIGATIAAATWSTRFDADAAGAVPQVIVHEGELAELSGEPIVGVARTTFKLYDAPLGGRPVWSESVEVEFDDGYFSVALGEATPLDASLLDGATRWLGVAVGKGPELPLRVAVASAAHPMYVDDPAGDPPTARVPTDDDVDAPEPGEGVYATSEARRPQGLVLDAAHADATLGPLVATAEYTFIGASMHLDLEPEQVVLVSAHAELGSTAAGGAADLDLSICARKAGSARMLDNRGDRREDLRVAANTRATFAVKTRFAGLGAGDHEFGLCVRVEGVSRWNDNGPARVAVLVTTR